MQYSGLPFLQLIILTLLNNIFITDVDVIPNFIFSINTIMLNIKFFQYHWDTGYIWRQKQILISEHLSTAQSNALRMQQKCYHIYSPWYTSETKSQKMFPISQGQENKQEQALKRDYLKIITNCFSVKPKIGSKKFLKSPFLPNYEFSFWKLIYNH